MSCANCGSACQGSRCKTCRLTEHQEDYYGVPSDHIDDEDGEVDE